MSASAGFRWVRKIERDKTPSAVAETITLAPGAGGRLGYDSRANAPPPTGPTRPSGHESGAYETPVGADPFVDTGLRADSIEAVRDRLILRLSRAPLGGPVPKTSVGERPMTNLHAAWAYRAGSESDRLKEPLWSGHEGGADRGVSE